MVSFGKKVLKLAKAAAPDPVDTPAFNELARRALIELSRRRLSRYEDQYDRDWFDALFNPDRPKPITIRALADAYVEERRIDFCVNGVSEKRLDKVVSHSNTLEIMGGDLSVGQVDDEIVQKVRRCLANCQSTELNDTLASRLRKHCKVQKSRGQNTLTHDTAAIPRRVSGAIEPCRSKEDAEQQSGE